MRLTAAFAATPTASAISRAGARPSATPSTWPLCPPPAPTHTSKPSINASAPRAKSPRSPSPPSCESSSYSPTPSSKRIASGYQLHLDTQHRCFPLDASARRMSAVCFGEGDLRAEVLIVVEDARQERQQLLGEGKSSAKCFLSADRVGRARPRKRIDPGWQEIDSVLDNKR